MSEGTGYEQLQGVPYSKDICDRICSELADGKSLRSICANDDMPSRISVFRWLREYPDFAEQYASARKDMADALADDLQAIANDTSLDHNHKRLQLDTLKWIASKLKPRAYGDKIAVGGDDETGPIQISWAKPE